VGLSGAGSFACAPDVTCDEVFTGGGDVVGSTDYDADGQPESIWVVTDPCENPVHAPPRQDSLINQPPHLSGEPPPEPSSGDWCQNLRFRPDGSIENLNTWFPRLPLQQHRSPGGGLASWYDAALTYEGNTYSFAALLYGRQRLELSARCLTSQGVSLTCEQLTTAIVTVWNSEPAVQNLACGPDAAGSGCVCDYDMVLNTGPAGTWAASGDVLTHFDSANGPPFQANYSVQGNALNLSGYHRTALFGQTGVRTLRLAKVMCSDGLQGPGEDGVDCGPYCTACP